MERLIMKYKIGDGFTYHAEQTTPILYSSKQEALEDLRVILLEFEDKNNVYQEVRDRLDNKMKNLVLKITKEQENDKKNAKEKSEEHKKSNDNFNLSNLQKEYTQLAEQYRQLVRPTSFEFGGNDFEYKDFIEIGEDNQIYIGLPNLYTVDEYFFYVERSVENKINYDKQILSKIKR